ncbi:MAG: glycosyltransferase [Candidatus Methanoplasma sp.]|jgi:1,2-diacylglycerol 3-alpha-glucosyltransferase|nr:glycosyltransferase [Candidatus Methanoplasma sp.]
MRIAMVTDSYLPTRDGVVTAVTTLRKALEDAGHTVFVVAPDPGEGHREEGVTYFPAKRFKKYPEYFLPVFPSNKMEAIRALEPDVIHIYGITLMAMKALIAARGLKIPTVATYLTNVADTMRFYSPLPLPADIQSRLAWIYMRNFLKRPHCVIALTSATLGEFEANGVRTKRTEVVPIGIDVERFRRGLDGSAIRERHGLRGRVAIHVGRVSYEKNLGVAIRAVRHMPGDVTLLVVGRGPALEDMKALARGEGLEGRVVFAGFVSDEELPLYYAASDVLVSASRFETQGLTVAEAMACGLPAACANGRAFLDVVEDGVNGFLFGDSPEECARAVEACLEHRAEMADAARRTAESYSMESVGKRLAAVYESLSRPKP